jgi:hypothetical protein
LTYAHLPQGISSLRRNVLISPTMPPSPVRNQRSAREAVVPFASEAAMTAVACCAWSAWWPLESAPDFVAVEVVAPGATADLAAASLDAQAIAVRHASGITPLTDWTSLACAVRCRRPLTANDVAAEVGLSRSGAHRALALACEAGALIRSERRFALHPQWQPVVRRLVAVELKLRDWQKGLAQAVRYRRWADASWVILGATGVSHASASSRKAGIGLARMSPDGEWMEAHKAKHRRPSIPLERRWAEEQILAQALRADARPHEIRALQATPAGELAVASG